MAREIQLKPFQTQVWNKAWGSRVPRSCVQQRGTAKAPLPAPRTQDRVTLLGQSFPSSQTSDMRLQGSPEPAQLQGPLIYPCLMRTAVMPVGMRVPRPAFTFPVS